VRTAGRRLGEALAAAVNLLNPEVIVVSGDLVGAHDHLLAGVREVVYQRSTALATQSLRIVEGRLADEAGIHGCIVLALEALLATEVIDDLVEGTVTTDAIA
jgi:predicted NBD/HSP70 family sugar kinase